MNTIDHELRLIAACMACGQIKLTHHADQRMRERGVVYDDLYELGRTMDCTKSYAMNRGRYLIQGCDMAGDPLRAVCVYEGHALVITVIGD